MNEGGVAGEFAAGIVIVRRPPPSGPGPANASPLDLDALGYVEHEYFFAGDAVSYALTSERSFDGRWDVEEAGSAPFASRLLVRRPIGPDRFSGVVLLEWLNVSGGVDGDPDWGYLSEEIIREGHAWVGVSVQVVGVMGGTDSVAGLSGGLVSVDPSRAIRNCTIPATRSPSTSSRRRAEPSAPQPASGRSDRWSRRRSSPSVNPSPARS